MSTFPSFTLLKQLLRSNDNHLQLLAEKLLIELVKYLHANQGALFLVYNENTDNIHAEAIASYAWERKRQNKKQIAYGEGLVGQVMQEGDTVYMYPPGRVAYNV